MQRQSDEEGAHLLHLLERVLPLLAAETALLERAAGFAPSQLQLLELTNQRFASGGVIICTFFGFVVVLRQEGFHPQSAVGDAAPLTKRVFY
jgi:hypothetical protein